MLSNTSFCLKGRGSFEDLCLDPKFKFWTYSTSDLAPNLAVSHKAAQILANSGIETSGQDELMRWCQTCAVRSGWSWRADVKTLILMTAVWCMMLTAALSLNGRNYIVKTNCNWSWTYTEKYLNDHSSWCIRLQSRTSISPQGGQMLDWLPAHSDNLNWAYYNSKTLARPWWTPAQGFPHATAQSTSQVMKWFVTVAKLTTIIATLRLRDEVDCRHEAGLKKGFLKKAVMFCKTNRSRYLKPDIWFANRCWIQQLLPPFAHPKDVCAVRSDVSFFGRR